MKSTPILFSAPTVKAILAGTKTQTRRIVKAPEGLVVQESMEAHCWDHSPAVEAWWPLIAADRMTATNAFRPVPCPYGKPGDRLVVLEAHALAIGDHHTTHGEVLVRYLADGTERTVEMSHATIDALQEQVTVRKARGRPGRFMPRWASRITLEVLRVRVERLQDITEEDARAEGVKPSDAAFVAEKDGPRHPELEMTARGAFACLWDSVNGYRASWKSNPWVFVIDFRRVDAAKGRTAA